MSQLRYVILRHEQIDQPHFDLMFELSPGGLLTTWRSDSWPIDRSMPVVKLPDHRRDYLTYEGPVSGERGIVRQIETGTLHILRQSATELLLELERLTGRWKVILRRYPTPDVGTQWHASPIPGQ